MGRGRKNRQETLPHAIQRLEKIRAQRDQLLATLQRIAAGDPDHTRFAVLAVIEARDAIANVEAAA